MAENADKGGMDVSEHEDTWKGFTAFTKWGTFFVTFLVLFAVLKFALDMGWMPSIITSILPVAVAAYLFR